MNQKALFQAADKKYQQARAAGASKETAEAMREKFIKDFYQRNEPENNTKGNHNIKVA